MIFNKMINREKFAMILGLIIVMAHIFISLYLWFKFSYGQEQKVFLKEISLPITLGYSISILKWFLDNNGIVSRTEKMGMPLVILISIITMSFIGGLIGLPLYFEYGKTLTVEALNNAYLTIESSFGAMFSLLFSYLYGDSQSTNKNIK